MTNFCKSVNNVWLIMIPITLKHTLGGNAFHKLLKSKTC